jgi:hypothetical protein
MGQLASEIEQLRALAKSQPFNTNLSRTDRVDTGSGENEKR